MSERPQPGERWRATYEGEVIPYDKHPSTGTWFAMRAVDGRATEEFYEADGWTYTKLRGTEVDVLRARVAELEEFIAQNVRVWDKD